MGNQIEEHFLLSMNMMKEAYANIMSLHCDIYVIDIDRTYVRTSITQNMLRKESIWVSFQQRLNVH